MAQGAEGERGTGGCPKVDSAPVETPLQAARRELAEAKAKIARMEADGGSRFDLNLDTIPDLGRTISRIVEYDRWTRIRKAVNDEFAKQP